VIWLESDLGPTREVPGGTIRPGTGREVAVRLIQARPRCRVLVNEGDSRARPLYRLLDSAGCSVEEVVHEGGDWLRDNWLLAMRRAVGLPEEDDDFDFENEDDFGDEEEDREEFDYA
jgi:hypothetical protein